MFESQATHACLDNAVCFFLEIIGEINDQFNN